MLLELNVFREKFCNLAPFVPTQLLVLKYPCYVRHAECCTRYKDKRWGSIGFGSLCQTGTKRRRH